MIMNFDQTPSNFAPVSSEALAIRGNSYVAIAGTLSNKMMTHKSDKNFAGYENFVQWKILPKPNFQKLAEFTWFTFAKSNTQGKRDILVRCYWTFG